MSHIPFGHVICNQCVVCAVVIPRYRSPTVYCKTTILWSWKSSVTSLLHILLHTTQIQSINVCSPVNSEQLSYISLYNKIIMIKTTSQNEPAGNDGKHLYKIFKVLFRVGLWCLRNPFWHFDDGASPQAVKSLDVSPRLPSGGLQSHRAVHRPDSGSVPGERDVSSGSLQSNSVFFQWKMCEEGPQLTSLPPPGPCSMEGRGWEEARRGAELQSAGTGQHAPGRAHEITVSVQVLPWVAREALLQGCSGMKSYSWRKPRDEDQWNYSSSIQTLTSAPGKCLLHTICYRISWMICCRVYSK